MDRHNTEGRGKILLSQEQIDAFHLEGYLAIDAVTDPTELIWLRGIYDSLFETGMARRSGDQFDLAGLGEEGKPEALPQILAPAKYAPELNDGAFRINAIAIAEQLLGPAAQLQGEHAILKPPRTGAATPWHQDEAY